MELNDTPSKRSDSDEEMVGKEYKVERLKRLTFEALPVGRGIGWNGRGTTIWVTMITQ